ncbi:MAG: cyclic nucleotide-binding domain-containing protein [Candidatus Eremiobacteraeota bacterium]|nr:cyclic nucleotide-binding domain-containing protein [Candidatus Eremiobacteraeota bacterium]
MMALVASRVDALQIGESFAFSTNLDPRALLMKLHSGRANQLLGEYRRVGEDEWYVDVKRLEVDRTSPTAKTVLQRSAPFTTLDDPARETLAASILEREYRRGQDVVPHNARFSYLGIVCEGTLAYANGAEGRQRIMGEYFPLEVFGDVSFFDGGRTMGRVTVLSKTAHVALIPHDVVRAVGMEHPEFLFALGAVCAQRARGLANALLAQASQPIIARVAQALMPYAVPANQLEPALPPLPTMTQMQIAAAAGTVKEVAARAIAELEARDAIKRDRGHICYLNRVRLSEIAKET